MKNFWIFLILAGAMMLGAIFWAENAAENWRSRREKIEWKIEENLRQNLAEKSVPAGASKTPFPLILSAFALIGIATIFILRSRENAQKNTIIANLTGTLSAVAARENQLLGNIDFSSQNPRSRQMLANQLCYENFRATLAISNAVQLAHLRNFCGKIERSRQNIADFLARASIQAEQLILDAGMDFELRVAENLRSREIETNPDFIEKIFTNLADNARKFAFSPDGIFRIDARGNAKNELEIRFSDSGFGVPAMHENLLFKMPKICSRNGLGLPLSRLIARKLDGEFSLEKNTPTGMLFLLKLPFWEVKK